MSNLCVAILQPGQMGASFGALIRHTSPATRLVTTLSGRSPRTRALALKAGFEDLSLDAILKESDVILSVVVPDAAASLAKRVALAAAGIPASERRPKFYADLNAVSPSTALRSAKAFETLHGLEFVDGGIIGGPATAGPGTPTAPLIVLSGAAAVQLHEILSPLFVGRTKVVGGDVGMASALKLSYAALTKGAIGLALNSAMLSRVWGVGDALEEELSQSQPALLKIMKNTPRSSAKAFRWVGEMEEISSAYASVGLEGGAKVFGGMASTYDFVAANSEVGKESIEDALAKQRTHNELVTILAKDLPTNIAK